MTRYALGMIFALYASQAISGEGHGIDPWQDANKAKFTEPTILIYQECREVPPEVADLMAELGGDRCETLSKYVWVPTFASAKAIVCLRARAKRLAQCFYRSTAGEIQAIEILPRGESI
jgi:hypothetical protein